MRQLASPAARLLAPAADDPGPAFALFGRAGRSPRVYAARDRDAVVKALQTAALKCLGITLAGAFGFAAALVSWSWMMGLSTFDCSLAESDSGVLI